jgi:hypothetical protein
VLTYVHTGLSYSEAVGATVTLAHRCPRDSVLDLTTTKRLQAATPPNYRLVRRTYDRLGAVSTWRMVQPMPPSGNPAIPQQTVACASIVGVGEVRHAATVRVVIRLSGPGATNGLFSSFHTSAATWDGQLATSRVQVEPLTTSGTSEIHIGTDNPNDAFAWGALGGVRGRASNVTQVELALRLTSDPP